MIGGRGEPPAHQSAPAAPPLVSPIPPRAMQTRCCTSHTMLWNVRLLPSSPDRTSVSSSRGSPEKHTTVSSWLHARAVAHLARLLFTQEFVIGRVSFVPFAVTPPISCFGIAPGTSTSIFVRGQLARAQLAHEHGHAVFHGEHAPTRRKNVGGSANQPFNSRYSDNCQQLFVSALLLSPFSLLSLLSLSSLSSLSPTHKPTPDEAGKFNELYGQYFSRAKPTLDGDNF